MNIICDETIETICPACRAVITFSGMNIDLRKSAQLKCTCGELIYIFMCFQAFTLDTLVSNIEEIRKVAEAQRQLQEGNKNAVEEMKNV